MVAAVLMALHCLCPALEGHITQAAPCHKVAIFTWPFNTKAVLTVGLPISRRLFEPFGLELGWL